MIIAGPNGAGKSTLAPRLLAGELDVRAFVNADIIAQGLAAFAPAAAAVQAGRTMLRWLAALRESGADFAFETTLSGLGLRSTLGELRAAGYTTSLVYLWLPDAEAAVERVRARVRLRGHPVPDEDVRRRYLRSVRNFGVYRRMVTAWRVYDAVRIQKGADLPLVASGIGDVVTELRDAEAWAALLRQANIDPSVEDE